MDNDPNHIILTEIQEQLKQKFACINTVITVSGTLYNIIDRDIAISVMILGNKIHVYMSIQTIHFVSDGTPLPTRDIVFSLHDPNCIQKVIEQILVLYNSGGYDSK